MFINANGGVARMERSGMRDPGFPPAFAGVHPGYETRNVRPGSCAARSAITVSPAIAI